MGSIVHPIHLAGNQIECETVRVAKSGDERLDTCAIKIRSVDLTEGGIHPIQLPGGDIKTDVLRCGQAGCHQVFDASTVKISALDLDGARIGPVHLAAGGIDRDKFRTDQSRSDQIFDVRAVQVRPLNLRARLIDPVDLAVGRVHIDAIRIVDPVRYQCGDVFDIGAIQVGALNLVRRNIGPVHLPCAHGTCCALLAAEGGNGLRVDPDSIGAVVEVQGIGARVCGLPEYVVQRVVDTPDTEVSARFIDLLDRLLPELRSSCADIDLQLEADPGVESDRRGAEVVLSGRRVEVCNEGQEGA